MLTSLTMLCDLVLEGGGAKGVAVVGAVRVLEARGYRWRKLVGTSAGAIAALGLAMGCSADEIDALLSERDYSGALVFTKFMDVAPESAYPHEVRKQSTLYKLFESIDLPFIPDRWESGVDERVFAELNENERFRMLFSLEEYGGLYEGNVFLEWLRSSLAKYGFNPAITMRELHARTGVDLSMVCADTHGCAKLVLNHRTAPDVPVVWATRASMSIPFLWQEVIWDAAWGTYCGRDISGHALVDGGLLSNFALDLLLESDDPLIAQVMGEQSAAQNADDVPVFGLLLDEELDVEGEPPLEADNFWSQFETVGRIDRLIETLLNARDRGHMRLYAKHVCRLPARGYKTTEFEMAESRREALIAAAERATVAFLDSSFKN